ncbi:zinc finger protein 665-like [Mercenaria mercenaria]|uniref:zinc finger protein 665-like n=1 Tax=Mercenaria mercenaria TaxID=6596 RepID=UPI00234F936F|nr:zinc finger protein 665-like [Mercenaria mercenaria]
MDVKWAKEITSEVQNMCETLKKLYYETAIIILEKDSGKTSIFGSSVGTAFLSHNRTVETLFHDFYETYKKETDNVGNPKRKINKLDVSNAEIILHKCDNQLTEDCSCTTEMDDIYEEKLSEHESVSRNEEHNNENTGLVSRRTTRQSSRKKMGVKGNGRKKKGKIPKTASFEIQSKDSPQIVTKSQKENAEDSKTSNIVDEVQTAYDCSKCNKCFKSKAGLMSHDMYIHSKNKDGTLSAMPEHRDRNVKLKYVDKDGNHKLGLRCSMYVKEIDNGNTNYQCKICPYLTERYNSIIEHSQIHVISELLGCALCDKTFKVKKSLWRHTNQHKKFPHMCKTCMRMYETKEELEEHKISHDPSHVCDVCNKTYDSIGRLNYHKKISHGPKQNTCDICSSSFASKSLLRQHKKRHGPKQFFCDKCSCSYYFMHQLTNHLKIHDENSIKYKCTVCSREYVNKSHWKEHVKLHDGSNFVQCDQCGKSYNSKKSLNLHKSSTHVDERKFICQVCGKAFLTKHHLKNHLITHDDERNYKCRFCDATFKKNDVLKMHENVHTKEQKYICDICGGHFLRRSSLRNHRLTHVPGHQRWKCRYCDTKFRTQSSMMTHIKNKHVELDLSHDRPLCKKCDQCGKVYAKGLAFRVHTDMHAGVKRHKCRVCGHAFTDPANLRMHLKIHDGSAKRYACDVCDSRFSSVKQYTIHREKHDKPAGLESLQYKQNAGQDLSIMLATKTEEVDNKYSPTVTVFARDKISQDVAAVTLHEMRSVNTGLVPVNTNHGLINTDQGLVNNSNLMNSSMLAPNLCSKIISTNTDIGNKQLNGGLADCQLRQNLNTDNLASVPGSSKQETDMKNYDEIQPQCSSVFRNYCSQYQ